jgi:hypothetical protein
MSRAAAALGRDLASWYLPLAAGALPILVVGFLASAVANRIIFAVWAAAAAGAYTALLAAGLARGWARRVRAGGLLLLLAASAAAFAALVAAHGEILDLGTRAVLPALRAPALARPATALVLAAVLALAAGVTLMRWRPAAPARAGTAGGQR